MILANSVVAEIINNGNTSVNRLSILVIYRD